MKISPRHEAALVATAGIGILALVGYLTLKGDWHSASTVKSTENDLVCTSENGLQETIPAGADVTEHSESRILGLTDMTYITFKPTTIKIQANRILEELITHPGRVNTRMVNPSNRSMIFSNLFSIRRARTIFFIGI